MNGALALALGKTCPSLVLLLATMGVGHLGYGLILILFIVSLGRIGTARTMGVFSAAPFVGATLAFTLLGDPLSSGFALGERLEAAGLFLALAPRHVHPHSHAGVAHSHNHARDDHHGHEHGPAALEGEPHAHEHTHDPLKCSHPHFPDTHHRYGY